MKIKIANRLKPKQHRSKVELIAELLEQEENIFEVQRALREIPGIRHNWRLWGRPAQFMPETEDWLVWAILADRGFGKTRAAAEAVNEWIMKGEKSRIAFLGATFPDVQHVMVEGESGFLNVVHPDVKAKYIKSKRLIRFETGAEIHLFSAEDPNRIRGANFDGAWIEEITRHRYPQAAETLFYSMRLGAKPQVIVTMDKRQIEEASVPKETFHCEGAVKILADKRTYTTVGETLENQFNLSEGWLKAFTEKYLNGGNLQNA